jgi:hypothetical protein
LRARSLMKPVFIEPEFVFVNVDTTVHYDITKTSINTDDIKTIVLDAILNYSNTNLNSFGKTLRYSRLSTAIDASHPAIVSNTTTIKLVRELGFADWQSASISKSFHTPVASVSSTRFYYQTNPCTIESSTDTSELFLVNSDTNAVIKTIGSLDRATGLVSISNIVPDDQTKPIGLYTNVNDTDIISAQNMILKIRDGDVTIRVERI